MKKLLSAAFAAAISGALLIQAAAKPATISATKTVVYKLPEETAALKPGPNQDVALANCTGCHSSDYIATQPKGTKFGADFWKAEVTKMVKVYGAPIDESDAPKIVEYLTKVYAEPN
jgi:mono/diheme cytochrome c family protein